MCTTYENKERFPKRHQGRNDTRQRTRQWVYTTEIRNTWAENTGIVNEWFFLLKMYKSDDMLGKFGIFAFRKILS